MKLSRLLTLLDRYIIGMLFQTILFGILLFTVIWLAPETLFKLVQYVFAGKLTMAQAGTMLLYHLPPVMQQSIPMAVFFGGIFLFRRLSMSSELVAMMGTGIGPARLMWPVLLMGITFSMFQFLIQEKITPVTAPKLENLYYDYGLKPRKDDNFVYVEKNSQGQLDKFILIGQTRQVKLMDFIILYYEETKDGGVQISRILRAPEGQWNNRENAWQLFNGIDYELDEEGVYHQVRKFREQWVGTSKYPAKLLDYSRINPINMSQKTLGDYIRLLQDGGQMQDVRFCKVRLNQQWAFVFASMLFSVMGAMMGMERVRANKADSLLFGVIVLFLYSVLIPFSTNLGSLGVFPPFLAAWTPLFVAVLSSALIIQARRWEG